jgi:hypothetical protein
MTTIREGKGKAAVSFDEAVVLGKRGGDRRSEKAKADQPDNVRLKDFGNAASYTRARLRRDAPELAQQVVSGGRKAHA